MLAVVVLVGVGIAVGIVLALLPLLLFALLLLLLLALVVATGSTSAAVVVGLQGLVCVTLITYGTFRSSSSVAVVTKTTNRDTLLRPVLLNGIASLSVME